MNGSMLAFISNISPGELVLVLIVAVLIFGRRLPEVAARGAIQVQKLRKGVQDFRRESGFDDEVRRARAMIENPVREMVKELDETNVRQPHIGRHPDALEEEREVLDLSQESDADAPQDMLENTADGEPERKQLEQQGEA